MEKQALKTYLFMNDIQMTDFNRWTEYALFYLP